MSHRCHATGCVANVDPIKWGCLRHWKMVPRAIQKRIWKAYRPGQCDDKRPSREYLEAARAATIAVAHFESVEPDTALYDFMLRGNLALPGVE